MNKLSTRRIAGLAACATLGVAVAASTVTAPEAGASPSIVVRTDVTWYGVECLNYRWADRYSDIHEGMECNPVHSASLTETAFSGDLVGLDPIMGAQYWIACQVYVNGRQVYADYAENNDGTDVNCMRRVN